MRGHRVIIRVTGQFQVRCLAARQEEASLHAGIAVGRVIGLVRPTLVFRPDATLRPAAEQRAPAAGRRVWFRLAGGVRQIHLVVVAQVRPGSLRPGGPPDRRDVARVEIAGWTAPAGAAGSTRPV